METKLKQLLKTIKLNESMLSMIFGVVTVLLIGVLVLRMYSANKPTITADAEKTEVAMEKVGDVTVEVKEDGKKYPTELAEKVVVEKGDNLWKIAEKQYGSGYNWVDIAEANNLTSPDMLNEGQELSIPDVEPKMATVVSILDDTSPDTISGATYEVQEGDNLWDISVRAYGDGFKWIEIANANNLENPDLIHHGNILVLPR